MGRVLGRGIRRYVRGVGAEPTVSKRRPHSQYPAFWGSEEHHRLAAP